MSRSSFFRKTIYYDTKGSGISILAGSIFLAGLGFKVIEGQFLSAERGTYPTQTGFARNSDESGGA
jgi:hypothetical protein